jgi:hypothetical protein
MTINRWFVRCLDCLSVAAVTEPPNTHDTRCGLCGGHIECMGRVAQQRLVRDEIRSACDDRCTSARGPLCDCHCGGKNHGTHRIVRIVRDAGPVPNVAMRSNFAARRTAEEYRAGRAAVLAQLDPLLSARRRGVFLTGGDFGHMHAMRKALEHAHQARTHEARMRALRAVLPTGWTHHDPADNPIAAVAIALNPSGGALETEVPFSLQPKTARRPEIQRGLFD